MKYGCDTTTSGYDIITTWIVALQTELKDEVLILCSYKSSGLKY